MLAIAILFSCNKEFLLISFCFSRALPQAFLHEISHSVIFSVWCHSFRLHDGPTVVFWTEYISLYEVDPKVHRPQLYLASILSDFHRPVRRFFLEFAFQILLAFLLMSMLHSNNLVLVESKSCTFWICFLCYSRDFMMGNSEKCILLPDKCRFCIYTSSSFGLVNSVPTSLTVDCFNILYFDLLAN